MKKRLLVIREPRSGVTKCCDEVKINLDQKQRNNAEVSSFWEAFGMEPAENRLTQRVEICQGKLGVTLLDFDASSEHPA